MVSYCSAQLYTAQGCKGASFKVAAGCISVTTYDQVSQNAAWEKAHDITARAIQNIDALLVAAGPHVYKVIGVTQIRIVAQAHRHLPIVREIETEVETNLKRAQALRRATLAKACSRSS